MNTNSVSTVVRLGPLPSQDPEGQGSRESDGYGGWCLDFERVYRRRRKWRRCKQRRIPGLELFSGTHEKPMLRYLYR